MTTIIKAKSISVGDVIVADGIKYLVVIQDDTWCLQCLDNGIVYHIGFIFDYDGYRQKHINIICEENQL